MVQNVKGIWKKMREQANAHLLELLNGELTHMTLAKLHTWENSGIIILLLRGVASSIIQPSSIMHKWSMHPLGNIYIWVLLCWKECVRASWTSTAHFYKLNITGGMNFTPEIVWQDHESWVPGTEGSYNIVFQFHQIFLPPQILISSYTHTNTHVFIWFRH